jgi:hypothetical protein
MLLAGKMATARIAAPDDFSITFLFAAIRALRIQRCIQATVPAKNQGFICPTKS